MICDYNLKLNLSLYLRYYTEACNEFTELISASLRLRNIAPFKDMLQRSVGNPVSNLIGPRFEPQTSRSRDERVTAQPTGGWFATINSKICISFQEKSTKSSTTTKDVWMLNPPEIPLQFWIASTPDRRNCKCKSKQN